MDHLGGGSARGSALGTAALGLGGAVIRVRRQAAAHAGLAWLVFASASWAHEPLFMASHEAPGGIVEAIFVQGEPVIAPETLTRFVHDAGFAPRWIDAELVGSLEVTSAGEASMRIRETDERVRLEDNDTLRGFLADEGQVPTVVRIRGRVEDDEASVMRLAPEWIREEASS